MGVELMSKKANKKPVAQEVRRVTVYRSEWSFEEQRRIKQPVGEGIFVGYGCDCMEGENGFGNFSTAIVEMPDGTVENVPLHLILFIQAPLGMPTLEDLEEMGLRTL
jgi:hypothetical protein